MAETLDALRLPLWGSRLIEASAGTGKTWTIAALYLRLVLGHGDAAAGADAGFGQPLRPAQILVMTFTRAATRELRDRIRARLVEAARCFRGQQQPLPPDALLQDLIAAYPAGPLREAAAWRLAAAAESMDDAAVHTIDAWCQRVLREHAFDSGSPFDEQLGADEQSLLTEATHDYWRQQVYPLAGEALDAVLAVWPGVERLTADLRGLLPYGLAAAVDTTAPSLAQVWQAAETTRRQAIQTLKTGWPARLPVMRVWLLAQLDLKACPFNKTMLRGDRVGTWLDALQAWADSADIALPDWSLTARQRLTPAGLDQARKSTAPLQIPDDFAALDQVLTHLETLAQPADAMRWHAAAQVAQQVQVLKARAAVFGFADMLVRLDAALAGANGARLRQRIVGQYPVALIDEFQDTSPLQYRIFDRLYHTAANQRSTALLLIGDPKQSIYAFRGADIGSYLAARAATAGRHYLLGTNHRSTAALVGVVNGMFELAEQRQGPGAFGFRVAPSPGQGEGWDGGGDVPGVQLSTPTPTLPLPGGGSNPLPFIPVLAQGRPERFVNSSGTVPALTLCHDPLLLANQASRQRLAQNAAEHIVTLLNDPQAGFQHPTQGFVRLRPADIAVLVRTGNEAAVMQQALRQRRVAAIYLSDRDSVFASAEAADLLHWLKALADPLDNRLARAALATATLALPLAELARLGQDDAAFERRIEQLRQLHAVWQRQGVLTMLRQTLHQFDLPARCLLLPDGERRLTNLLHLAELLQAASAQLDGEQALIRWLAEHLADPRASGDEQVLRLESDADLVQVVTVYKAKGLEYPVVLLPFASSFRGAERSRKRYGFIAVAQPEGDRQPDFRMAPAVVAAADQQRLQEDLRLLYVALTRARHALWVGVAALKIGNVKACVFHRSAIGSLLAGQRELAEGEIAGVLVDALGGALGGAGDDASDVVLQSVGTAPPITRLMPRDAPPPLIPAAVYNAQFERHWTIGSFSSLVRDLSAQPAAFQSAAGSARGQELLAAPDEADAALLSDLPRHRFPRGALAGNFLHDQLEWLAGQHFALTTDAGLAAGLRKRCDRLGWGHRADDLLAWLAEVVSTVLPPVGVALASLGPLLPEMEFWFPSERLQASTLDQLCQQHLLAGRPRPALPERTLQGLLMGFADLVFEQGGRYFVLDYKSNALGAHDAHYHHQALEAAMAEHRYDVQAAIYLLALHRLLRLRLGPDYNPMQHLGGAVYLFLRGVQGPENGCYLVKPSLDLLQALEAALDGNAEAAT